MYFTLFMGIFALKNELFAVIVGFWLEINSLTVTNLFTNAHR